jgi:diguanylate cyclase (GGDEF)-like protein/PAS domain S-box-containing protein
MGRVLPIGALPVPAIVVNRRGRTVAANAAAYRLFATCEDDLAGLDAAALFPAEGAFWRRCEDALEHDGNVRLQALRRNGVPFTADAELAALTGGEVLIVLREVRGHRLLEESQRYLDVAFDTAPIGMALFNTDGEYERVNGALCGLLGRPADELLGRRDQELTHPDDRQADLDAAARILAGAQDTFQAEKRFVRPDGSVVWTIASLAFLRDEAGRPLCWLGQFQDITRQKADEERLRHLADHDELTGIPNRRRLVAHLQRCLQTAARRGDKGALLMLDLDGFKGVNDNLGHAAGDALLVDVAAGLRGHLGPHDLLARVGGDEFAVVLEHADRVRAAAIAGRLLAALSVAGGGLVTASCGIALYGPGGPSLPEHVLATADKAMYRAKHRGRNTISLEEHLRAA